MTQGLPQLNFSPPPGYQIVSYLGGGAMGQVFKAVQTTLDRTVAIKTTLPAANPRLNLSPQRLLNEARTIAKLDHPGIVGIYDCFVVEERIFIVMEYLDGLTLGDILYAASPEELPEPFGEMLVRAGQLHPEWVKRIGVEVARALHFAHRRGICHRDIKPSNLFITKTGTIKIIDFSIAIDAADTRLTATGSVIGSPPYMSPEQIRGDKIDGRSDIYALGCVLFHAITGKVPFYDTSEVLVCMKHLEAQPPDPASLTAMCDAQLQGVILRCLGKKPEERFQTGGDLAQVLEMTPTSSVTVLRSLGRPSGGASEAMPAGSRPIREMGTTSREFAGILAGANPNGTVEDQATTLMESPSKTIKAGEGAGTVAGAARRRSPVLVALMTMIGVGACAVAAWIFIQQMDKDLMGGATSAGPPGSTMTVTPTPMGTEAPVMVAMGETPAGPEETAAAAILEAPPEPENPLPPSPFAEDAADLNETWERFAAWAMTRGAREWPIVASGLGIDSHPGSATLRLANTTEMRAEFSFLMVDGTLTVWAVNDAGDWTLRRTDRSLAGVGGGAAFGNPPLRLNAGEELAIAMVGGVETPEAPGFLMRANVRDIRLAAVPAFHDIAATATLAIGDMATTGMMTAASDGISTSSVVIAMGGIEEEELEESITGPVAASAGTDEGGFSIGQAVVKPQSAAALVFDGEPAGEAWRGRMRGRLALAAGHPAVDARLRTVDDAGAAAGLEAFLRTMAARAGQGRLIDVGLYNFRKVDVDRYTGEIDLEFEFLAPEQEIEVSWFIVDGEQRLRAREGSQTRELWRPLRGLHGIARRAAVNRGARSFTLALDEVFSEQELRERQLNYERTDRIVIRTMLVICAQTREGGGGTGESPQDPAYELVTGIRWGGQP